MRKVILVTILAVAAFLRFYQLGVNPPSLTWDEVAWGYNAYALGVDGKDEFGRFLPYDYLESFGDFKPPMYAYLSILPVKLFGITEFATRFASAFLGTLTVLMTYFLTREIFLNKKSASHQVIKSSSLNTDESDDKKLYDLKTLRLDKSLIALIAAAIMAISPWHIMLSRAAFEANVASFFLVLGMFLFIQAMNRNAWLLIFSAISFVASMYTFNTARIVGPLLVIMLAIGFGKKLFAHKKQTMVAILVGLALLLPLVPFLFSDQAKLRFKEVNIFTDIGVVEYANQDVANDNNAWWSKIIHNRRVGFTLSYLGHYFDNLSFQFLFIQGDGNPKFSTQAVGQMYLWELPFFIAGILFLFRKRRGHWWVIPLWLLLAITPAATARETPHALRIETALPTFQILVAYGVVQFLRVISNVKYQIFTIKLKYVVFTCFGIIVLGSLAYFWENYSQHYAKEFAKEWQYGYKDAISYINEVEGKYNKVYITESLGRPYAYLLFYKQYDPVTFRKEARVEREALGFVNVLGVEKFYFGKAKKELSRDKNVLYVDIPSEVPGMAKIQKKFYLPSGDVALAAYTLN